MSQRPLLAMYYSAKEPSHRDASFRQWNSTSEGHKDHWNHNLLDFFEKFSIVKGFVPCSNDAIIIKLVGNGFSDKNNLRESQSTSIPNTYIIITLISSYILWFFVSIRKIPHKMLKLSLYRLNGILGASNAIHFLFQLKKISLNQFKCISLLISPYSFCRSQFS